MELTNEIIEAEIERLRLVGTDTAKVEVKSAAGGFPKSLLSSISAFSNTGGGLVILGLDEARAFAPAVGFDAVAMADALKDIARPRRLDEVPGPLNPIPLMDIELIPYEGATIVVAEVHELPNDEKPCFVVTQGKERGSYQRLADGDHQMSTYAVFLYSSNRRQPDDDSQLVTGSGIGDLDDQLLDRFVRRIRAEKPRVAAGLTGDTELLMRLKVLAPDGKHLTRAGLLCLGSYPQEFFPQLMVTLASYPGRTKDTVVGDLRMLDRATIEGPIPIIADEAIRALLRNLRSRRVVNGAGAEDQAEIPVEALREAVVNALAHRDYSQFVQGEQVRIDIYPDRVEITSPGGIWGGRSAKDLFDETSRSRNSVLTKLLVDVPFTDRNETVSENLGSGIPRMVGTMRSLGLPIPKFKVTDTSFTTVLLRHGLMDPDVAQWLEDVGAGGLKEPERLALALFRRGQELNDQVLRSQLGMDSLDALTVLLDLTRQGWLARPSRPGLNFRPGSLLNAGQPTLALFDLESTRSDIDVVINDLLESKREITAKEIQDRSGYPIGSIRNRLRVLVDRGAIEPTAAATSRNRAYRRPQATE